MSEPTLAEREAFKEKLRSIQWGVSTQNPGTRRNYYDAESVEQIFSERVIENHREINEGVPLKWDRGTPYYKDKAGDYVKADKQIIERVMYGKPEKEARSVGFVSGKNTGGSG